MKNLFIVALLFGVALLGCHKAGPLKTIIAGHVNHLETFPDQNTITLRVWDYGRGLVTYIGDIDKKGNFKIEFNQYFPEDVALRQDVWTSPIVEAMIAHPGDSIHVDLDYKNITDVKFTGDAAETNTDLFTYNTGNYSVVDMFPHVRMFQTEKKIRDLCQFIKKDLLDKRKDFIEKEVPNDEVKIWTLHDVELKYYVALVNMLNDPHNAARYTFIADKTVEFGKDVDEIYDTKLLNARGYTLLSALMPGEKWFVDKVFIAPEQKVKSKLAQINKSNYTPLVKQLQTGYLFHTTIAQQDLAIFDHNRAAVDTNITEPFIKGPLMQYYQEMKQNLADPPVASNSNYKPGATLLDSVITQNKGKVIYVDLWATWCRPCRAEMPNAEKLKNQYKNKGVAFAAICLGATKKEWQSLVADLKLSPGQYYTEGADMNNIMKALHMRAFPHYLIVNKQGRY